MMAYNLKQILALGVHPIYSIVSHLFLVSAELKFEDATQVGTHAAAHATISEQNNVLLPDLRLSYQ